MKENINSQALEGPSVIATPDQVRGKQGAVWGGFKRFQSLIALLLLCIVLSLLSDKFFTTENGLNVLRQVAVNICIATGMTMIVLTAGIDLSVGSVLALCGAVTAGLLKNGLAFAGADLFVGFTVLRNTGRFIIGHIDRLC
jgi:ribose transport system permease protein